MHSIENVETQEGPRIIMMQASPHLSLIKESLYFRKSWKRVSAVIKNVT